ncbi:MAG: hypothetical protein MZW92_32350 [Comamonadaceae bacterium]|nr:hypothetical protein [Comamonadaceae bacterium]
MNAPRTINVRARRSRAGAADHRAGVPAAPLGEPGGGARHDAAALRAPAAATTKRLEAAQKALGEAGVADHSGRPGLKARPWMQPPRASKERLAALWRRCHGGVAACDGAAVYAEIAGTLRRAGAPLPHAGARRRPASCASTKSRAGSATPTPSRSRSGSTT